MKSFHTTSHLWDMASCGGHALWVKNSIQIVTTWMRNNINNNLIIILFALFCVSNVWFFSKLFGSLHYLKPIFKTNISLLKEIIAAGKDQSRSFNSWLDWSIRTKNLKNDKIKTADIQTYKLKELLISGKNSSHYFHCLNTHIILGNFSLNTTKGTNDILHNNTF